MALSDNGIATAIKFYIDTSLRAKNPSENSIKEAQRILLELSRVSISELLVGLQTQEEIPVNSASIPQFSSLDDCFNSIDKLVRSGLDGVSFAKIGFFLRISQRKKGADCKYGENHIKCAELMGLCQIENGVWKNSYSYAYDQLSDEMKMRIKPKLCLGIPIIREYFNHGESSSYLVDAFSCLSESTRKRRMPNVKTLISIVKSDLR